MAFGMCLMSPRWSVQLKQTGKGCWDIGDAWVKVHPPSLFFSISFFLLLPFSSSSSSLFWFFFLPLFHHLLTTYFRMEDVSTEERNPTLSVNGTVCWLTSAWSLWAMPPHWSFLAAVQGRLRHMSLVVTEVMLTMGRWLRGDWTVFTALLLKGSNLESSNSTCKEGKMLKQ